MKKISCLIALIFATPLLACKHGEVKSSTENVMVEDLGTLVEDLGTLSVSELFQKRSNYE